MQFVIMVLIMGLLHGTAAAKEPITVLPLGDSITHGMPTLDGYRGILRELLEKQGHVVRFIGTETSGAGAHEGWPGYTSAELLLRVEPALQKQKPDFVLLHIGTNDIGIGIGADKAAKGTAKLLERIFALSPQSEVLLAQIISMVRAGPQFESEVRKLNLALVALAEERRKAGHSVDLVDMHKVVDPKQDLADELHPNSSGYRKMAHAWSSAIVRKLKQRRK